MLANNKILPQLLALCLVTLGSGSCSSRGAVAEPDAAPRMQQTGPEDEGINPNDVYDASYAVVIGIDLYENFPDISGAKDARKVGEILKEQGFEVTELLDDDASLARIRGVLGEELRKKINPKDRVLIFFAGHGIATSTETGPMGYLMPVDGSRDAPVATGISMSELQIWMTGYKAKHVMFVADACYSGLAVTSRSAQADPADPGYIQQITSRPVRYTIASGDADQKAFETQNQGIFTMYFIRAISGEADYDGDGIITSDEVFLFVRKNVQRYAADLGKHQRPRNSAQGDGEFIFFAPSKPQGADADPAFAGRVAAYVAKHAPWWYSSEHDPTQYCRFAEEGHEEGEYEIAWSTRYSKCLEKYREHFKWVRSQFNGQAEALKMETLPLYENARSSDEKTSILWVQKAALDNLLAELKFHLSETQEMMLGDLIWIRRQQAKLLEEHGDVDGAMKLLDRMLQYIGAEGDFAHLVLDLRVAQAQILTSGNQYRAAKVFLEPESWVLPKTGWQDDVRENGKWMSSRKYAIYNLVDVLINLGEFQRAWQTIEDALADYPDFEWLHFEAAVYAVVRGEKDLLEERIRIARATNSEWAWVSSFENRLLGFQDGRSLTTEELRARASLLNSWGWYANMRGDWATAKPILEECVTITDGEYDEQIRNHRGYCLSSLAYGYATLSSPSEYSVGLQFIGRHESMVTDKASDSGTVAEFLISKATLLSYTGRRAEAEAVLQALPGLVAGYEWLARDLYWFEQRMLGLTNP